MILVRLSGPSIAIDVRVLGVRGRWIASADSHDGPTLGLGESVEEAIERALLPLAGKVTGLGSLRRSDLS